jgi:fucose permease
MSRNYAIVVLVFVIFFVLSLLTNILGPIVPDIINSFHVSLAAAAFLPFSFFIAYGVMSIPVGFLVDRFTEKPVMVASFVAALAGALSFALVPTYHVAVVSLFVIGTGMAALQVAINPLLRVAGGEEHFAFNSACAQLIFGVASFLSPLIYSYLIENLSANHTSGPLLRTLSAITPPHLAWVSIYWIFAACAAVMVVVLIAVRLPKVERTADEQAGTTDMYRSLLRKPMVWAFFLTMFAYVASEQGTADWMSKFLSQYHGFDPHVAGARAVSWFWGLMTIGCLVGMGLLKLFDSRKVLIAFSIGALACLTAALFAPARISLYAFPAIGFFASVMWPTVVSLGLNSVAEYHGSFAGILCTGIMGGAVGPFVIGSLGDLFGLRTGMLVLYVTFGCVLLLGFWAKPIISNKIVGKREVAAPASL